MLRIKRALISVSDKTGLVEFAKYLNEKGTEILSTGGTAKLLRANGIKVTAVSDYTGSPEILDGRVKSLHPKIHGGLLALRSNPEHMRQLKEQGIGTIDLVCVNLYPFEKTIAKKSVSLDEAIENIDIGGPSMLRSAAKNYRNVAVICNPAKYKTVISEIESCGGITDNTLATLAKEVFERTSAYDKTIHSFLTGESSKMNFPQNIELVYEKAQDLRYGENPHQKAAFYIDKAVKEACVSNAKQLHGKELSYNNIMDLDAAVEIVKEFKEPAAVVIKHTNPCGAAVAKTLVKAYKDALKCDPLSAFGSIVGLNRKLDIPTAKAIFSADFVECVIAPDYAKEALRLLKQKKNLRILKTRQFGKQRNFNDLNCKKVVGGLLLQERDLKTADKKNLGIVTKRRPTKSQIEEFLFGWIICKHLKSNAIVLSKDKRTVGLGAGQMSRVDSVIIAIRKAGKLAGGATLASDAFFPKEDAIKTAAKAGIKAIIQPGGSIRDKEIIAAADKAGITMVFTGMRHFRH